MKKVYFALMTFLITSFLVACNSGEEQNANDSSGESSESQVENTENGNEAEKEDTTTDQGNGNETDTSDSKQLSESDIVGYELQIDLINEEKYDYSYDSQDNEYEIEVGNGNTQEITGEDAKADLEELRGFAHIDRISR